MVLGAAIVAAEFRLGLAMMLVALGMAVGFWVYFRRLRRFMENEQESASFGASAGIRVLILRTNADDPTDEPEWKCQLVIDRDQFSPAQAADALEAVITGIRMTEQDDAPQRNGKRMTP